MPFFGLSLSLAPSSEPILASLRGHFHCCPCFFSLFVILWVTGFDILYALQDEEFDKKEHLKSFPARVGKRKALVISALFHVCTIGIIVLTGFQGGFHQSYWIGALIFSLLLTYEHAIVKPTDISRVNLAFATLNGTASVLYAVFVILDLFLNRFGG